MSNLLVIFIIGFFYAFFTFILWSESSIKKGNATSDIINYINEQSVRWGLFMRPTSNSSKFIFANKYSLLEVNFFKYPIQIKITNKISREEIIFTLKHTGSIMYSAQFSDALKGLKELFVLLFSNYTYETTAEDLIQKIESFEYKITIVAHLARRKKLLEKNKQKTFNNLYLDINQASEAELTALPGVTIAKAKHAIKMRNKYAFYLSMNQFYETINLDEQFIEQIQTKGNKILLNTLPEYRRLEMKREV